MIVRVNVVLNRTVVVDSERLRQPMCSSHLQSQRLLGSNLSQFKYYYSLLQEKVTRQVE